MVESVHADDEELGLLLRGDVIATEGLFAWGSNYTYLVVLRASGRTGRAVYKPQKGERPLWDFPEGSLCLRETAAYIVSQALGWPIVPPTVLREGGAYGFGSFQWFVETDPEAHFFTLRDSHPEAFRRIALFDLLVNNADRKSGHCLLGRDGHVRAIDHGVCFHEHAKLRTVIWDYVGEPIPGDLRRDVERLHDQIVRGSALSDALAPLLSPAEIEALDRRATDLLELGEFPPPGPGRPYPWPLV
ncbi:MAG: SCO1664 family protein [Chloroflexi bacterium]|nr:SCO1664 family protein [Chloroflexota bacterium]